MLRFPHCFPVLFTLIVLLIHMAERIYLNKEHTIKRSLRFLIKSQVKSKSPEVVKGSTDNKTLRNVEPNQVKQTYIF